MIADAYYGFADRMAAERDIVIERLLVTGRFPKMLWEFDPVTASKALSELAKSLALPDDVFVGDPSSYNYAAIYNGGK